MQLKYLSDLFLLCKNMGKPKKLAVICAEDDHTLDAVLKAHFEGLLKAILIGKTSVIQKLLSESAYKTDGLELVNAQDEQQCVHKAVEMIHKNQADYLMKGTIETKTLMKIIVAKDSNLRTDRLMSHFSIIENPNYHKLLALSDSALNTKPDVEQKHQILINSVEVLHKMGIEYPKVAVLAASETVNLKLQASADAAKLKDMYLKGEIQGCILEGPISLDLAIEPESARIKSFQSPVAGDADLLICPDLVSGNMMGKGMLFTGAKNAGIIVGARVPIVLCSRASTMEDKFYSILLGSIASI